jgi:rhodanese-related sulfurtransferase
MALPTLPRTEDPGSLCEDGHPVALVELRSATTIARGRAARFLLLDVRDRQAFALGHVRGALCVPRAEIASLARRLPRGRCLVAYAADAASPLAAEAAAELRARGLLSSPLAAGFAEWVEAGLPVHAGPVPAGETRCSCAAVPVRPPSALRAG